MITTWGHDPGIVPVSNVLLALNDALSHSAVLVQVSLEPISMETEGLLPSAVLLLFKPKYRVSWVVEKEQSSFPVIASLGQKRNFSAWEKQRPEIRQRSPTTEITAFWLARFVVVLFTFKRLPPTYRCDLSLILTYSSGIISDHQPIT